MIELCRVFIIAAVRYGVYDLSVSWSDYLRSFVGAPVVGVLLLPYYYCYYIVVLFIIIIIVVLIIIILSSYFYH